MAFLLMLDPWLLSIMLSISRQRGCGKNVRLEIYNISPFLSCDNENAVKLDLQFIHRYETASAWWFRWC